MRPGRGPPPSRDTPLAVQSECRSAPSHPQAAVTGHAVGSEGWHAAVFRANKANSDHMGEEEREGLTDFRIHTPLQLRHDLAVRFAVFDAAHINGIEPVDKDPQSYIAEHQ